MYFVAVASNAALPGVPVGLLSAGDQGPPGEPRVPDDDGGITSLVAAVRDREARIAASVSRSPNAISESSLSMRRCATERGKPLR
jgi:hypothetical protein